jgi:hypothetical protein
MRRVGESLSPIIDDGFPFGPALVDSWAIRNRVTRTVRRSDRKGARELEKHGVAPMPPDPS